MQPFTVDNWLEWKHQFQVFLATRNNRLGESRKLTLFLDCLGAEGLAVVYKLFPKLRSNKRKAKKTVSFAQVWWQFNEHCWLKYNPERDPFKDSLEEDRAKLQQICEEEVDEVRRIIDYYIETIFPQLELFS